MTFRLNKDQRITEIDFVRGLCILAVHIGHCSIDLGAVTYLWQSFFMSAFFIFSGYLSKSKPSSLLKLLKSTLLLYYLWTIGLHALMAFQDIRHGTFSLPVWISELKPIILGISQPGESAQLWFLIALFTTKLIWEIILRLFADVKSRLLITSLIAAVGIFLNLNGVKSVPFRAVTAMIMLPLFVFGYMLSNRYSQFPHKYTCPYFVALITVYFLGTFLNVKPFGHNISVWEELFNYFPLFYCNAISGTTVFLLGSVLIDRIGNTVLVRLRNVICYYGRNSLTAFLTVNFLIVIVYKLFSKIGLYAFVSSETCNILVCVTVIILQIPTARLLNNPKIAKIALLK